MKPAYAGAVAAVLVVLAIALGLAAGTIFRPPPPTPRVVVVTPSPAPRTATPSPTTDPNVFRQRLAGGCATDQSIWVVANGGGLVRFDGEHWTVVDSTLRTLVHAACDDALLYAVGPAGAVLSVDDRSRQIRAVDVTIRDLYGIAPLPDGALAVGDAGTVMRLVGGFWQPYARGIEEDLRAVAVFSDGSAWAVGAAGVAYRLEPAGWRPVATRVDATLRSVAGPNVANVVAVGDGGTVIAWTGGRWFTVDSGVEENLRAVARTAAAAWVVGEKGVVLTVEGLTSPGVPAKPIAVTRLDLRTACDLVSVFVRGDDVWIIGEDGASSGVWRLRGGTIAQHWGAC